MCNQSFVKLKSLQIGNDIANNSLITTITALTYESILPVMKQHVLVVSFLLLCFPNHLQTNNIQQEKA